MSGRPIVICYICVFWMVLFYGFVHCDKKNVISMRRESPPSSNTSTNVFPVGDTVNKRLLSFRPKLEKEVLSAEFSQPTTEDWDL